MTDYNTRLEELRRQISEKNGLEQRLQQLQKQEPELIDKVYSLEQLMYKEQADVERLEHHSLAALYYSIIGQKQDKIDKEQQEAYTARVKYDTAAAELRAVRADIQKTKLALQAVEKSEKLYQEVLQEKAAFLKANNNADAEKILQFEQEAVGLEGLHRELTEAIAAGDSALATVEQILKQLDDADEMSTWDMLGGGLLVDMAKHESLDNAQEMVETLQIQLRRFKTELSDVNISADLQVTIDGFTLFADYFFDGIFADWAVQEEIHDSIKQVQKIRDDILSVKNKLTNLLSTTEKDLHQKLHEMNKYILEQ